MVSPSTSFRINEAEPLKAGLVYGSQFMVHGIKSRGPIQRKER
jgi:hypothetical protein